MYRRRILGKHAAGAQGSAQAALNPLMPHITQQVLICGGIILSRLRPEWWCFTLFAHLRSPHLLFSYIKKRATAPTISRSKLISGEQAKNHSAPPNRSLSFYETGNTVTVENTLTVYWCICLNISAHTWAYAVSQRSPPPRDQAASNEKEPEQMTFCILGKNK